MGYLLSGLLNSSPQFKPIESWKNYTPRPLTLDSLSLCIFMNISRPQKTFHKTILLRHKQNPIYYFSKKFHFQLIFLEISFLLCHLIIKVNAFLPSTLPWKLREFSLNKHQINNKTLIILKEIEKPQLHRCNSRFLYDNFILLLLLETI